MKSSSPIRRVILVAILKIGCGIAGCVAAVGLIALASLVIADLKNKVPPYLTLHPLLTAGVFVAGVSVAFWLSRVANKLEKPSEPSHEKTSP